MPIPPRPVPGATPEERTLFWHACIAAVECSEITARDLCRQAGVSKCSFYAWRKRLRSPPAAAPSPAPTRARPAAPRTAAVPEFVEIAPAGMAAAPASAAASSAAPSSGVAWLAELTHLSAALHAHLAGASR